MTARQMFVHAYNNINYFAILMFSDLEYLKQGFLETLESLV